MSLMLESSKRFHSRSIDDQTRFRCVAMIMSMKKLRPPNAYACENADACGNAVGITVDDQIISGQKGLTSPFVFASSRPNTLSNMSNAMHNYNFFHIFILNLIDLLSRPHLITIFLGQSNTW